MVQAVLQAMSLYLLSVLAALEAILKKIREIQRNFLWGSKDGHQKWALVDWDTTFTPKEAARLGLKDTEDISKVLGAKIWWHWVTHKEEPWEMLWHKKYAPR